MESMINNLINGNLTDAKKQAKKFSYKAIVRYCMKDVMWSQSKSVYAAMYLKKGVMWQLFCDSEG